MDTKTRIGRDDLERVAAEYRRLREEHHRARPASRTRRHLGAKLQRLERRFDHLLEHAGLGENEQRRWHDHLRHGAPEPGAPLRAAPLVFAGRSASGAELRLVARGDGTLDAVVDGTLAARVDGDDALLRTTPGATFELGRTVYAEEFATLPQQLAELREALAAERQPPRALLPALHADGLLDRDFGLTPRGRRALGLDAAPARHLRAVPAPVAVSVHGPVPEAARVRLEEVLERAARLAPRPPLRLRGTLLHHRDPARARPAVARAAVDMGALVVRARVAAPTDAEAVDLVDERLRERLRAAGSRRRDAARRPR